jgi:hypothetical protein
MLRSIIVNFPSYCIRGAPLALALTASTIALTACNGTGGHGAVDGFSGSSTAHDRNLSNGGYPGVGDPNSIK